VICTHPLRERELRKKRAVGGGVRFLIQCQKCGRQVGPALSVDELEDARNVRPWNQWRARKPQPGRKKREYQKRLQSPSWQKLREIIRERDHYECQTCGAYTTEVGHRTYERFQNERLEDLELQCSDCNQEERQQRVTRHVLG